jgi:hypothetical protein
MGRWASILLVVVVLGIALRACIFPSRREPGELRAQETRTPTQPGKDGEAKLLFNGRNLDNWELVGDARFSVAGDCIVGETGSGRSNSFLATRSEYADFRLELDLRLHASGNSGVQVRSEIVRDKTGAGVHVRGYQIEVDPSERAWSGGLYEERGRGWLADLKQNEAGRKAFRPDEWNHYSILCQGAHFMVQVNGITTCDTYDGRRLAGCIALQIHSGPAMRMAWKNLRLTPLASSVWQAQPEPADQKALAELRIGRDASVRLLKKDRASSPSPSGANGGVLRLRCGESGAQPEQQLECLRWDKQGIDVLWQSAAWSDWKELELHLAGSRLALIADGKRVCDALLTDCPVGEGLRYDPGLASLERLVAAP